MYQNHTTQQKNLPQSIEETPVSFVHTSKHIFQPYNNKQGIIIYDLQDMIPKQHPARIVDELVESIPDKVFLDYYKGGGRPSFHPKMMLKIMLYAYSQKIYSSRGIEKMLTENLPMMWLAALGKPDHRTINLFRSSRLQTMIDELFETMIHELIEQDYIAFENYFLDGTKIEADANKFTFVWKKNAERYLATITEKIRETLSHIHDVTETEEKEFLTEAIQQEKIEISSLNRIVDSIEVEVNDLTERIAQTTGEEKKNLVKKQMSLKKPLKILKTDLVVRKVKYEEQLAICGDRNSYSKTDKDATFMRTKDDHMKNGQLKPCYNVQMATENQFILFYSIHQRPGDMRCFIPHMEKLAASSLPIPKNVVADAGYGSEENYMYVVENGKYELLAPYYMYRNEKTRKYKQTIKHASNWSYNEQEDYFICPNGRRVEFKRYSEDKPNDSGYIRSYKHYECEDCSDCPLQTMCKTAKGNRTVKWNPVNEEMKAKARAALGSDEGAAIYAKRKIDVESVFGHIKGNRSLRRFFLRGLDKVHVEFGLVAMAHNILKVVALRQLLSRKSDPNTKNSKTVKEKRIVFLRLFYFLDLLDSPYNPFVSLVLIKYLSQKFSQVQLVNHLLNIA